MRDGHRASRDKPHEKAEAPGVSVDVVRARGSGASPTLATGSFVGLGLAPGPLEVSSLETERVGGGLLLKALPTLPALPPPFFRCFLWVRGQL